MLDVSILNEEQEQANIIFDTLAFIHNETFYPTSQMDKRQLLWMRTAVNAIVDIINNHLAHPFTKDGQKAGEEFLKQSFNLIRNLSETPQKLVNFLRTIIGFVNNFPLGSLLISLILEEVQRTGELLLQSFYSAASPGLTFGVFRVYVKLLHSLLPNFGLTASLVIGVGNPEKDKLVIPKVSLAEIRRFSSYLDSWTTFVDCLLLGFSQVSKEFSSDLRQVKKLISDIKQRIFLTKNG